MTNWENQESISKHYNSNRIASVLVDYSEHTLYIFTERDQYYGTKH